MKGAWAKEWKLFLKAPANVLVLLVLLAASVLGAVNGVRHVHGQGLLVTEAVTDDRQAYTEKTAALQALEAGQIEEGRFDSARLAHQALLNRNAERPLLPPPAELEVLSSAQLKPTPAVLRIGIQTRHQDQQPSLEDPSNRLDGPFDLVFVSTWLLPLFALILGYDVVAKDREQGIAALLATQTALDGLMLRRLAIRLLALLAVVGGTAAVAVVATESQSLFRAVPAFAAWLLGLALVTLFWLALAAIVNAFARNSAQASLVLLAAWIGIALLVPAMVGAVVSKAAPAPDHLQRVLTLREIEADLNRRKAEVTQAYYRERPLNRPIRQGDEYEHYFVTEFYPRQLAFDRAFAPIAAGFEAQRVRQARVMRWASLFSPPLALKLLSEDLAGAAPERRVAFLQAADAFQAAWRGHFDFKMASMTPLTQADYETMPVFEPVPEPWHARWLRIAQLLLLMFLPLLAAGQGVRAALRRINPL